jgi:hypothetical protein
MVTSLLHSQAAEQSVGPRQIVGDGAGVDAFSWRMAPAPTLPVAKDEDRLLIVIDIRLAVLVVPVHVGPLWVTEGADGPLVAPVLTRLA